MMQHTGQGRGAAAMHAEHDKRGRSGKPALIAPRYGPQPARRLAGERYVIHAGSFPARPGFYHEFSKFVILANTSRGFGYGNRYWNNDRFCTLAKASSA